MKKVRYHTKQAPTTGEIPFPRLRDQSTTSKKNVIQAVEIDQVVLIANLEQVFDKLVRGSIRKLKNSPSELPEDETTASWPYGTSRKKLNKLSPSPLDRWKSFLNSNFDRINKYVGIQWSSINDEKEDKKNTEAENNDDDGSNHGITSVSLSSVLRPGLPEDYIEIFEQRLGSMQELISDDIANLSAVGQDIDNIDIEALKTKIAELKAVYKLQQKERKRSNKAYQEAKSSLGTESLDILRDPRLKRAQAITDAENTATRLKDMRMMLYNITRSLKKEPTGRDQEKAENTNKTLPTLRHYACEESPSNIDISVLEKEAFDAGKTLGYSGTDYGLRTMSTTVAMTQEKLQYHISLYNRFAALDDTELDGNMAPDTTAESSNTNDGENFIA
ncbi:hypothetical protein VTP01DRAFT_9881 [Rhizomucor pusillus]|uniref:uncharacterized protein n=1 Tax=Rhizomucor pusillus TaxID=4840 RepID=UPI003743BF45